MEFYAYFIGQNLTAGLGLRSRGNEGVPRECLPNGSAGAMSDPRCDTTPHKEQG